MIFLKPTKFVGSLTVKRHTGVSLFRKNSIDNVFPVGTTRKYITITSSKMLRVPDGIIAYLDGEIIENSGKNRTKHTETIIGPQDRYYNAFAGNISVEKNR